MAVLRMARLRVLIVGAVLSTRMQSKAKAFQSKITSARTVECPVESTKTPIQMLVTIVVRRAKIEDLTWRETSVDLLRIMSANSVFVQHNTKSEACNPNVGYDCSGTTGAKCTWETG